MTTSTLGHLVCNLATGTEGDGELVRRFVDNRCAEAFEELVRRHGRKVYLVCRRTLRDHHLAEDAFQATFLALARKAHALRNHSDLGGWLYGVARYAALFANRGVRRRKTRETLPGTLPEPPTDALNPDPDDSADLLLAVDLLLAAIADLPEKYRSAVALCEIDGMSQKLAAERLRISVDQLKGRLARARKVLAKKLRQRGVVLPTTLGVALATLDSSRAMSAVLVDSLVQSVKTGTVPEAVAPIVQEVLMSMFWIKLKRFGLLLLLALCAIGGPAIAVTHSDDPPRDQSAQAANEPKRQAPEQGARQGAPSELRNAGEPEAPPAISSTDAQKLAAKVEELEEALRAERRKVEELKEALRKKEEASREADHKLSLASEYIHKLIDTMGTWIREAERLKQEIERLKQESKQLKKENEDLRPKPKPPQPPQPVQWPNRRP